jgi:hypothetical protein
LFTVLFYIIRSGKLYSQRVYGGSVWESNPPFRFVAGNTGFEVQAGHQNPMRSPGDKDNTAKNDT